MASLLPEIDGWEQNNEESTRELLQASMWASSTKGLDLVFDQV